MVRQGFDVLELALGFYEFGVADQDFGTGNMMLINTMHANGAGRSV